MSDYLFFLLFQILEYLRRGFCSLIEEKSEQPLNLEDLFWFGVQTVLAQLDEGILSFRFPSKF